MRYSTILQSIVVATCCWIAVGQISAEPIRLNLSESDQPIQHQVPSQFPYTETAQPVPYRPFSLSLTADGEPPEIPSVRQVSAEMPPQPQDGTDVSVRTPDGAKVVLPESDGPLRIFRIHEEPIQNPAAPSGTSVYSEQSAPVAPAQETKPAPAEATQPETPSAEPSTATTDNPAGPFPNYRYARPRVVPTPGSKPAVQLAPQPSPVPKEEPAAPITPVQTPEPEPQPVATPKPLTAWEIIPRQTTLAQINAAWGEPSQQRRIDEDKRVRQYDQRDECAKVEIAIEGDEIISVYMILEKPMPRTSLEQRLALVDLDPAQVQDTSGRRLGIIYPEKGVMLPMSADTIQVERIIIQAPSAEAFMLRAHGRSPLAFRDRLADCQLAIDQEPHYADAWYQMSTILHRLGREQEAFEAARKATAGVGSLPEYRLYRTLLSAAQGKLASGIHSTQQIAEDSTVDPQIRAKAHCQWGDFLQLAGPQKNREAVQHHVKAIELASPLVNDTNQQTRRAAKRVLVDAHLSLAIDIATGDWERKEEVVNQWLQRSKVYIDDMVSNEDGTGELRMAWLTKSLMAHSFYGAPFDPGDSVDQILGQYREMVSQTDDPFFHRALEWETGQALSQAVFIQHARQQHDEALKLAEQAQTFLKGGQVGREITIADHLLLGNLYFRAGAICAVQKQKHDSAVQWYDLAMSHLTDPSVNNIMLDRRGESLVSMGVSYWSIGRREQGISLTEKGKGLIESAIAQDAGLQPKLIVPLDNLAEMYREMGDSEKSAAYTASSKKIQQTLGSGPVSR
ncbi:hypothetical protein [Bremerella cremea]|uniref:hypothetical protein n=1 Tax=Bremerella cremea TaxID=1031537 RepID=UPI0031E541F3